MSIILLQFLLYLEEVGTALKYDGRRPYRRRQWLVTAELGFAQHKGMAWKSVKTDIKTHPCKKNNTSGGDMDQLWHRNHEKRSKDGIWRTFPDFLTFPLGQVKKTTLELRLESRLSGESHG